VVIDRILRSGLGLLDRTYTPNRLGATRSTRHQPVQRRGRTRPRPWAERGAGGVDRALRARRRRDIRAI